MYRRGSSSGDFARTSRGTRRALVAIAGVFCLLLCQAGAASADWVYTPVSNWNLTETANTYGSFNSSSNGTDTRYRWTDDPSHTTVIAANDCSTGALWGPTAEIPAHNTAYHVLGPAYAGGCFNLRGRVAIGAGSMSGRSGMIAR
jgi:hypothetical protein